MYDIATNIDAVENDARKFIMENDRDLFVPFLAAVEKYCSENKIVFGGIIGQHMALGIPFTVRFDPWDLYATNVEETGMALAHIVFNTKSSHIDVTTTVLQTVFRGMEMEIRLRARTIVRIYKLDQYRGADLVSVMNPSMHEGIYTKLPCLCFPPEMQLIDICRKLYTPSKFDTVMDDVEMENKLFAKYTSTREGGKNDANKIPDKQYATSVILSKVCIRPDIVVIGDYAVDALMKRQSTGGARLQFITEINMDDLMEICRREMRSGTRTLSSEFKLTYVKYYTNTPSDFQLTKYSVYIASKNGQVALADVYNSATYELVPFWPMQIRHDGAQISLRIGNPWVVLRFIFVDIWIMKLIAAMTKNALPARYDHLMKSITEVRNIAMHLVETDGLKLFQLDNYIGTCINELAAKRRMIKEKRVFVPPYYPAAQKNNHR